MTGTESTNARWVIVIGELNRADAAAIRLHPITVDGEQLFPVFGNPEAARKALANSPARDKTLQINLDLLRESLPDDALLLFDPGVGSPRRMTVAELDLLQSGKD